MNSTKGKDEKKNLFTIRKVSGNTYCLYGPIIIPLYMTDTSHCILMDTGTEMMRNDIMARLAEADITPIGIMGTHSHYDHFGNAGFFSEYYDCPIALPLGEAEICRTEAAVKSHLFCFSAGQIASDPKMSAIPCVVDHVIRPEETDTLFRGVRFGVIHTPGHAIDHVSYMTPDRVCYIGDALMCGHSLTASKLPYAFNFGQSLKSIESLRELDCTHMIMAHRGIIEAPFEDLIEENLFVMNREIEAVSHLIDRQMTVEEVYSTIEEKMGIHVNSPEKALDLERFLRPYLEYLIDRGSHKQSIRNGLLCYEPA